MLVDQHYNLIKRPNEGIAGSNWINEIIDVLASQNLDTFNTVLDHYRNHPVMVQIQQNGSDTDGFPTYDVFSLNDTGHVNKLNETPIVPENDRNTDYTYTAGITGELQLNDNNDFFLFVYNERASCP